MVAPRNLKEEFQQTGGRPRHARAWRQLHAFSKQDRWIHGHLRSPARALAFLRNYSENRFSLPRFYGDSFLGRLVYGDSKGELHCTDGPRW